MMIDPYVKNGETRLHQPTKKWGWTSRVDHTDSPVFCWKSFSQMCEEVNETAWNVREVNMTESKQT